MGFHLQEARCGQFSPHFISSSEKEPHFFFLFFFLRTMSFLALTYVFW